jgi:hypothetical protein
MQKTAGSFGGASTWRAAQLTRVPRLIRLITEMKTRTNRHLN